jgi:uncharacterized protein with NAD-binding domain and iron-sulfur cluster
MGKRKIAVLGGGVGALTAAFELTNQPGWSERYDITLYQMGWRLGGKGASGRNAAIADRIQEHGLHLWMGFYENAFDTIRQAYEYCAEHNLTPGTPFPSYRDAFKPMNFTAVAEEYPANSWSLWPVAWPATGAFPGDPGGEDESSFDRSTPRGYLRAILSGIRGELDRVLENRPILFAAVNALADRLGIFANGLAPRAGAPPGTESLAPDLHFADLDRLVNGLRAFLLGFGKLLELLVDRDPALRRLLTIVETGTSIAIGMIADDVLGKGFGSIEHYDFTEWLAKHGHPHPKNALTISMYDACFAYKGGVPEGFNMAAGSTLYGALRLMFTYRGALMWWMEAGMGDTIFTPVYKALEHRGVKFEFFHKVTKLNAPADRVDSIDIDVQAKLRGATYDPLVNVKGLLCWPSEPLWDQLEPMGGPFVNPDLESWWTDVPPAGRKTLKAGEDFDTVVLGISLGALPFLCADFRRDPAWNAMLDNVLTVRTQAFQLWLNRTVAEMGWPYAQPGTPPDLRQAPVLCGFVEPFDTWAQMDHLIQRESWTAADNCRQIAYFCNAAPDDPNQKPFSDPAYPATQLEPVGTAASVFLYANGDTIWKNGFTYSDLVNRTGAPGLDSQFLRINIDPSERYVLSVKGSTEYRLRADESRFENLVLAGDWTLVDVNLGCVEAAVQSGKMASYAIAGEPKFLFGAFRRELPMDEIGRSYQPKAQAAESSGG